MSRLHGRFSGKSIIFFLFLSAGTLHVYAQEHPICDLGFAEHLVNKGYYLEALFLLDSAGQCSGVDNDTANYLRGWSLYSLEKLQRSAEYLLKVEPTSQYYPKAHFFASYDFIHIGRYGEALKILAKPGTETLRYAPLTAFERAGISLLKRDTAGFRLSIDSVDRSRFELANYIDKLEKLSADLRTHKAKSPVVAGLMSAVLPGSGKWYAGKRGGAISAFLANAGLGLVTWENGRKSGYTSARTLLFGSAFLVSYVANIYGAVVSVKIQEKDYYESTNNTILFNLHIPLRNIFDR